jgi:hypothetical protein
MVSPTFILLPVNDADSVALVMRITSLNQGLKAWMIPQPRVNPMPVLLGMSDPVNSLIADCPLTGLRYIFLGHKGDPNMKRGPEWAKEGSFLVFRQLDQKVPEFERFLEEWAPKVPGTNYKGPNGPAKLGAHLMGRWKSGRSTIPIS